MEPCGTPESNSFEKAVCVTSLDIWLTSLMSQFCNKHIMNHAVKSFGKIHPSRYLCGKS